MKSTNTSVTNCIVHMLFQKMETQPYVDNNMCVCVCVYVCVCVCVCVCVRGRARARIYVALGLSWLN